MRPLSGVRVIEFCSVAAGPYCAMLLADMGADVIKVENPDGGDSMRQWPPLNAGYSENFASLNRNKRSVALNLKNPADRARACDLISTADVVLENNRPGVMQRLGLGYATVSASQPRIIYCSISAFGQEGPRSRESGFDLTIQAISGIVSVTGRPNEQPIKCGVPVSDFGAGLYAAFAIASALLKVKSGSAGTHIDVSLLGSSLAISALQTSEYFGTNCNPQRYGSAHPRNAPYQIFRASDGHFAMAAGNDALYRAACRALERPDLSDHPYFKSASLRAQNQRELLAILEGIFESEPCDEWLARFRMAGVPCSPINSYAEALADPQVDFMGWVQPLTLPSGTETRTFVSPLKFSGESFPVYRNPPALGEHNHEIFSSELDPLVTQRNGS